MKIRPLYRLIIFSSLWFAGCAIPAESPVGDTARLREYFWQAGQGSLRYDVYHGLTAMPEIHTITLKDSGEVIYAEDQSTSGTGRIVTRTSPSAVMLMDVDGSALFPLPEGSYVSKYSREEYVKRYYGVTNFAYFDRGAVAFTGAGWFYSTDGTNWLPSESTFDGVVTAVKVVGTNAIWAGTAAGALFYSENGGRTWFAKATSLKGEVCSIEVEEGAVILAVRDKGVFVYKGGQVSALGSIPTEKVTGLVLNHDSQQRTWVVASTRNKGLIRTLASGKESWQLYNSNFQPTELLGIYALGTTFVLTLAEGVYYTSIDTMMNWVKARLNLGIMSENIQIADVGVNGVTLATNFGNVFFHSWSSGSAVPVGTVESNVSAIDLRDDGSAYTASTLGLKRIHANEEIENVGPFTLEVDSSRGEFVLLRSFSTELVEGSSWQAGTLYLPASSINPYVPITARVMERLDTLQADGESFADVFAVRYAFEHEPGVPLSIAPYWVIYYARGIGPVMIDRLDNTMNSSNPSSRAIYKRE